MTPGSSTPSAPSTSADKLAQLHERLADQIAALRSGEDWQRWLRTAARFHDYSFQNTLLILGQRPDATTVAGYETWKALGRQVNRGEKGIAILAPIRRRTLSSPSSAVTSDGDAAGDERDDAPGAARRTAVAGFRVTYVWDVAQTSGPPLTEPPRPRLLQGQAPDGLWQAMSELAGGAGFTLTRGPAGGANGLTDFGNRTVRVRADVDDAQAVKTLAHELGHVRLHAPDTAAGVSGVMACRGLIEVEAESVAYLVASVHGVDSGGYTFPYVLGWASDVPGHAPEDVVRVTGERVLSAARWILAATETTAASPETPVLARTRSQAVTRPRRGAEWGPLLEDAARETAPAVHDEAAQFFRRCVENSWVLPYLRSRRLEAALDAPWEAGRAPAGWTTLVTHLRRQGVDDQTLLASGLAIRARTGRLIDTFRERLMLPIRDDAGHVVGFVGRAHPDASTRTPKYLNSHSTGLYAKSTHLFGVHETSPLLDGGAVPVLVEGPLDAVAVTSALGGRGAGLAVCGSLLTPTHLAHLRQHVDLEERGVLVAFDADPAGHHAATEAAVALDSRGIRALGVGLSAGDDPAGLLQKRGAGELAASFLGRAVPLNDLVVDWCVQRWEQHLHTVEGRVGAARAVAGLLVGLTDDAAAEQVTRTAARLDVDPRTITDEMTRLGRQPFPGRGQNTAPRVQDAARRPVQGRVPPGGAWSLGPGTSRRGR